MVNPNNINIIIALILTIAIFGIVYLIIKYSTNIYTYLSILTGIFLSVYLWFFPKKSNKLDKIHTDVTYMLKSIDDIFNKHNIWYVSAFGTLLGTVRHHGMIPWDDDGDILVKRTDVSNIMKLKEEFEKVGLLLEIDWKLIKVYKKGSEMPFVDMFIFDDVDGKFYRCKRPFNDKCNMPQVKDNEWWWKWVGFPTDWVTQRKRARFGNIELWIPIKSKEILEYQYGKDVLTTCKSPEYDHNTSKYIESFRLDCGNLPEPQL